MSSDQGLTLLGGQGAPGPEEGQHLPKAPIGPISAAWGPISAYLKEKRDRHFTDHDGDAADRSPTVRGDRRTSRRDRHTVDHQRGLPKPNSSSVGMVIGPIGASRSSERGVAGPEALTLRKLPLPSGLGRKLSVSL